MGLKESAILAFIGAIVGAIAGAISIPTRHLHQVVEMCNIDDVLNSTNLLTKCAQKFDEYNWQP